MDITRDKDVEAGVRRIIGDSLLALRKDNGLTAKQFCDLLGISTSFYAELEQGEKIMNMHRWLRSISTLGGKLTLTTPSGQKIELSDIYDMPPYTDRQREYWQRQREITDEMERRNAENRAFRNRMSMHIVKPEDDQ